MTRGRIDPPKSQNTDPNVLVLTLPISETNLSIRNIRRWWQVRTGKVDTPIDGGVAFWIVSLAFHLVVIVFLAKIIMPVEETKTVNLTVDDPVTEVMEEEIPPVLEFDEFLTEEIGADGDDGFEAAAAQAPTIDVTNEDPIDLQMTEREVGPLITDNDFFEATAENLSSVAVKGSVGNSVKAASGAVDRITQEILLSMEERNTVVVWMFDQSASLMRQREEILTRFDRIYEELGMIEESGHKAFAGEDQPLLTQVYSFGVKVNKLLPKPSNKLTEIKSAVEKIERDTSGIENVMEAVTVATKAHSNFRKTDRTTGEPKANVMIIIVSDEAGDDVEKLDDTIKVCNNLQMPIYVIGVPAPFGRPETKVKWVDPDPEFDQSAQWAIVSQGPESILPERLQLDFTGTFDDLDMIDSGFGPFHLTRLAYETGGIYFAVHPNRTTARRVKKWETKNYSAHLQYFYEPDIMRRYRPDYVSAQTYKMRVSDNKARRALVTAAQFTTTGQLESPVLRFEKLDEARFVRSVSTAQQGSALITPAVNRLYEMLRSGESERPEEVSPRWQAGYDLAMGRAIAAKVRAESYNAMLALIKTKLKFDPPKNKDTPQNNTWILEPADVIETGSQDAKLLAKAKMYLNRVVDEHEGTPWAMLAKRELETPIGWKWSQAYTEPPKPRERQNNNNNNDRPMAKPKDNMMPKTKRPPPRL